jgi:hypothetical protein
MGEMMRDQVRQFKNEDIEVESPAQTLERYRQTL